MWKEDESLGPTVRSTAFSFPIFFSWIVNQATWSLLSIVPVLFALLMRKKGGFYYRSLMSTIGVGAAAAYGMAASLTLPLVRKAGLINWSVARLYYQICRLLLGISTTIEGEEYLDPARGPAVYVCNHQSNMDIFFMASVFPKNTSVVAKKALKYYPVLGWFSKWAWGADAMKRRGPIWFWLSYCATPSPFP